jgi:hypothetical protein
VTAPTHGGTERGPEGDELEHRTQSDRRDATTQWRIFVSMGTFIAVITIVYWFVSYEVAGTTMLALAAALALFCGAFLRREEGRLEAGGVAPTEAGAAREVDDGPYLPSASIWPFAIGISAALALNGLVIGWPYAVPGVALLGLGVTGWVGQGRRRA